MAYGQDEAANTFVESQAFDSVAGVSVPTPAAGPNNNDSGMDIDVVQCHDHGNVVDSVAIDRGNVVDSVVVYHGNVVASVAVDDAFRQGLRNLLNTGNKSALAT